MRAGLRQPWTSGIRAVFSSTEQKAVDGAQILGEALGLTAVEREDLGENDRSATGFLPKEEFEATANEFFAHPDQSVRGWETATEAQRRIRGALDAILAGAPDGDIAIVSHGAVGTLLLCHLSGAAIARENDQPPDAVGGFFYSFDTETRVLDHPWKRLDVLPGEERLDAERRRFAEELRVRSSLETQRLVDAFATVPRETFFGLGPWRVVGTSGYETTPTDDPALLYENILIAIDEGRLLNNGEPAALGLWFDRLALHPGARALHVGAGVGYYTAILAETVGPAGNVTGIELDRDLAARARENTARWPNVAIESANGAAFTLAPESFDAIFVNAGATHPVPAWLDALKVGGRLLVPLTTSDRPTDLGIGQVIEIERRKAEYGARSVSPVGIYPCIGARQETANAALRRAFEKGASERISHLVRAPHAEGSACWLHGDGFCLQMHGR